MTKDFFFGSIVVLVLCTFARAQPRYATKDKPADGIPDEAYLLNVFGEGITPKQQAQFTQHFLSQFYVTLWPLSAEAHKGVIEDQLYAVRIISKREDVSNDRDVVSYDGKSFHSLPLTDTDKDLPGLLVLLDKSFKLKSDADAQCFQTALDEVYPVNRKGDFGDDEDVKSIRHDGNRWYFIRGKFFEKLKGFVLTTQDDGTITKVAYSLQIKKE